MFVLLKTGTVSWAFLQFMKLGNAQVFLPEIHESSENRKKRRCYGFYFDGPNIRKVLLNHFDWRTTEIAVQKNVQSMYCVLCLSDVLSRNKFWYLFYMIYYPSTSYTILMIFIWININTNKCCLFTFRNLCNSLRN